MFEFPQIWNGTLREHYLILFSVAGTVALAAGIIGAWIGARFGARRLVRDVLAALPTSQQQELAALQLAQLSQAVDAMSIEVERFSEGQRYTAKLLTDRASTHMPNASTDRPVGQTTPH